MNKWAKIFLLLNFADFICSCLPAYLEDLLVGGLEEAVADAVSVEPPREVFQPQLTLEVAAALRRGKSEMRRRVTVCRSVAVVALNGNGLRGCADAAFSLYSTQAKVQSIPVNSHSTFTRFPSLCLLSCVHSEISLCTQLKETEGRKLCKH